ncbi:aspartate carbamoyltransferase regulatory subunit [Eubacterium aggregans]|jgi:aspartate carbamoyltransferase regulatory subunit|uniref:Aspartate carbamoyltransferase regulatory subunit n=1 Tax=Eubacterium aggregans TaxID=81409 RepID=A0A1H4CS49_9FIRM|nr:aspartate carbamoyltransferase regulatory subunit [Eubacterium aggregans]MDD4692218.1 aspartate carbamoyltransferase regulatory subunit [Eubacterium aggregans]SEA63174.1 aspartate carbamoyltransferase regulatory subunit [Eubacterium aggregans]
MINVSELKEGIVIDHIEAGHGFKIYQELHLDQLEYPVVLLNNIPSHKMGKKDMLKIETDLDLDMDVLGLIDPNVTVNIVRNGELVEKISLTLPKEVDGIMTCKNPRCITQYENVGKIRFYLENEEERIYRCEYCDAYTTFIEKE